MLSNCQIQLALKLTFLFETSKTVPDYKVCVKLDDDHGYSSGLIQFTTGTGSAYQVLRYYSGLSYPNEFSTINQTMESLEQLIISSGTTQGSTVGLESYCSSWGIAASSPFFQKAQLAILAQSYWQPAVNAGKGLKNPASLAAIYDSSIQLGLTATKGLMPPMQKDEKAWVTQLLVNRAKKLADLSGEYAKTVTRVKSLQYVVDNNDPEWKDTILALNNDGSEIQLNCDDSFTLPVMSELVPPPVEPYFSSGLKEGFIWSGLIISGSHAFMTM